jgi:NAD(P)-dependent dehydrogenase (short-subunit alcohol dehydrogenase family)
MRLASSIAQSRKPRSPRRAPPPPTPLAELLGKSAAKVGQTFSVSLRDAAPVPASIARAGACKFNPRASYLLFGGCGGLGLLIATWLVQNGARHIVLTSRSGEAFFRRPACYREAGVLAGLRQLPGVHIEVVKADGASQADTQAVFDKVIAAKLYPAGVFWLPVTLSDGSAESRTQADFDMTRASKTAGLEHILKCPLSAYCDFIIATSSLATVVGSPGQVSSPAVCSSAALR